MIDFVYLYIANTSKWQTFTLQTGGELHHARNKLLDYWLRHKNMHELASLRFLKLSLEYQNTKLGRRTYEHLFFLS